jgi:hypothetical protein
MRVLRAVVHQQQHRRRRQAFHQQVEQRLRFRIDPVQVLEHEQERLDLALPQQQPLQRVEGEPAPLRGVEPHPLRLVLAHVQERKEHRQGRLQRAVQRHELARHFFPDAPHVVARLDLEIAPQQLDDREVRRGLPVRHRRPFQHQPLRAAVRVRELPDEA